MENKIEFSLKINENFDSLYKLGYFLVDLNSILNFSHKLNIQSTAEAKNLKDYKYGITSRYLNKDSLDIIKLVKFEQGSLFTVIIGPVIVIVIAAIIEKYMNIDRNQPKLEIKTNNLTINNIINNFNNNQSLEKNLENTIKSMKEQKLLDQDGILYDMNGRKLLIKNIERLKGQLIDGKW